MVRSASTAGAVAAVGARRARVFMPWIRFRTFIASASTEEVACVLAALAALGAGFALPADLHDLRRQLDAVLLRDRVERARAGHLGLGCRLLLPLRRRALRTARRARGGPACGGGFSRRAGRHGHDLR